MQINATVGLLYAQMGMASRVASDAATAPEASLAMARTIANEMAKLEQKQVQAPESSVEARVADDGEFERNSRGQFQGGERQEKEQEPTDEPSKPSDPLVGKLLNIKV